MPERRMVSLREFIMKTASAHIRPAAPADAPEIARLASELGYQSTAADIAGRLTQMHGQSRYLVAVAEAQAGRLAGWVCAERRLVLESGEEIEITGLVIDAAQRRRGLGKALIAEVERWAGQQGLPFIVVRSNIARTEPHVFYPGAGFSRMKTQHVYLKGSAQDSSAQPS
jgi:predicted N-acetyltransferase YhbS